ncbi:Chloride intracellular channel 4 [Paragonimus heterotremus]|uniref:Chloride intracellular channel 4 n=1 Tax=Paragonimus heterotremus TaxID=100268 RepID=A0A8J4WGA5_9TREM|nr:Chloride intracellular channel 4 [Paragonimus heterotremus]
MTEKPLVDLFVPVAQSDPTQSGACSISHKWFMLEYLLMERNLIDLRVTPISPDLPPPGYRKLNVGRRLPVLLVTEHIGPRQSHSRLLERMPMVIAETEDDRDGLLAKWYIPGFLPQTQYASLTCDLVSGLNCLLRYGLTSRLLKGLNELENTLERISKRFLDSEQPGYNDCALAPKLQHVRVAAAYYCGFYIPDTMTHVWAYLANLYSLDAFRVSCPSDKDILLHYLERISNKDVSQMAKRKRQIFRLPNKFRLFTHPKYMMCSPRKTNLSTVIPELVQPKVNKKKEVESITNQPEENQPIRKFQTLLRLNENDPAVDEGDSVTTAPTNNAGRWHINRNAVIEPLLAYRRRNLLYRQIPPSRYFDIK